MTSKFEASPDGSTVYLTPEEIEARKKEFELQEKSRREYEKEHAVKAMERDTRGQHEGSPLNAGEKSNMLPEMFVSPVANKPAEIVPLIQRNRPSGVENVEEAQDVAIARVVGGLNLAFASGKAPIPSKVREKAKALHEGSQRAVLCRSSLVSLKDQSK